MKTTKIILSIACTFLLNVTAFAQFNTIGTYNHKRINTTNPPKPIEAPTDSILIFEKNEYHSTSQDSLDAASSISLVSLPLKSIHITSGFGMRMHPIYHKRMMHNGVDLTARYENVYSMFPGSVIKVGEDDRSGKFVTVKTGDYTISYCHLSVPLVKPGTFVNAGDNIAISGNTGASTNAHLHITAKKDGKAFDAATLLNFILQMKEL